MYYHKKHFQFCLFVVMTVVAKDFCIAQETAPAFLSKKSWLQNNDLKKWDQNLTLILEASRLIGESNQSYLKMSAMSDNDSIDENKKEKQIEKLEKEAISQLNQALNKYKEAYTGLLTIVFQYVEENEEKHPAYSDMIIYSEKAKEIYKEIGNEENDETRQKLTQANEMQLQAVEKGVDIFTKPATEYTNQDIVLDFQEPTSEDFRVDAGFLKKYRSYISNNSIPDPITINRLLAREGDDSNFDSFMELWYKYLYMTFGQLSQEDFQNLSELGITDSLKYDSVMAQITMQANLISDGTNNSTSRDYTTTSTGANSNLGNDKTNVNTGQATSRDEIDRTKFGSGKAEAQRIASELLSAEVYNASLPDFSNSYEFRVQVAASKVKMSLTQIKAIYNGKYTVTEVNEGGFYKYQIRGFMFLSEAQTACSQSGVNNAYITAYRSNVLVPLGVAVKDVRGLESKALKYGKQNTINPIEFTVQIAASRVRMSDEYLNKIYTGQWPVVVNFEDGWYKYQIHCQSDLQLALNVIENSGVEKAFLLGYKYGERLELYKALHEYKTFKP